MNVLCLVANPFVAILHSESGCLFYAITARTDNLGILPKKVLSLGSFPGGPSAGSSAVTGLRRQNRDEEWHCRFHPFGPFVASSKFVPTSC